MRLSIRWKLIIAISVPLVVLSAVTLVNDYRRVRDQALEQSARYVEATAQYYAASIDGHLAKLAQVDGSTAQFLETRQDLTEAQIYELLRRNVAQDPLMYGSCVAYAPYLFQPGRRLFAPYVYRGEAFNKASGEDSPTMPLLTMDVASAYDYTEPKWEWFNKPQKTLAPFWTEPFFDEGAGNIIMCTHITPFFRNGKFAGTVNTDLPLRRLQAHIGAKGSGQGGFLILSSKGMIVTHSNPDFIMKDALTLAKATSMPQIAELAQAMMSGQAGAQRVRDFDGPGWSFISYAPIPSAGWSFGATIPEAVVMAPVYAWLQQRTIILLVSIAMIGGITMLAAFLITRPIPRLAAAVHQLASGNLDARVTNINSRDELGDLARTFNGMMGKLKENLDELAKETAARHAVQSELKVAREIQKALLPRRFPPYPNRPEFDLHAVNAAAKSVAGDFFDFFFVNDETLMLVIADVSGKGMPAALFMAVTRTLFRELARTGTPPGPLLTHANRLLLEDNPDNTMFVTAILASYNVRTGEICLANAGHPPPYLLNGGDHALPFGQVTGTLLGVFAGEQYTEWRGTIEPGQRLVFFTDGVPEARAPGGEFFGDQRFESLLGKQAGRGARELCEAVASCVVGFQAQELADDITLMVVGRK